MKTLHRSRLNYKLIKAQQFSLTFASAPSGFGKSTALHSYFDSKPVDSLWFSMFQIEDEEWVWNRILCSMEETLQVKFDEYSLPTTRIQLDAFLKSLDKKLKKPLFIMLDDVRLADIPKILNVLSMYSYISHNLLHFVILTRDPLQLLHTYKLSTQILALDIKDFIFSKKEIIQLCHLEDMKLSADDIDYLYTYTKGWIHAIALLFDTYKNTHTLFHHTDLYSRIRAIFYDSLDIEVQHGLMKLCVLDTFSMPFADEVCSSKKMIDTLTKLEQETFFLEVLDDHQYQFIPILKEFLTQQLLASSIDIEELHVSIGNKYLARDFPLDAIKYFLKIRSFDAIIDILKQYQDISFSDIEPDLMMDVFKQLPDHLKNEHPYLYLKWILDCITNFPSMQGVALLEDFKQRIDDGRIQKDKQQLYGEYTFIKAFLSFNNVQMMMDGFKEAYHYFQGSTSKFAYPFMITSFGSCHMLFLYYNKPSYLYQTVKYITENIHYFVSITGGLHTGTTNLIKAEYVYETGYIDEASMYATKAYKEAMETKQISSAICCMFLLGRAAFMQHKKEEFAQILKELHELYHTLNSPILHSEIDCALGYLYILSNQTDKVSDWLKQGDFNVSYTLPEGDMIAYIVHGLYLCKDRNIKALRNHIQVIREYNEHYAFAMASNFNDLFEIVTYCEIGDVQTASILFKKLLATCQQDNILMFLVECAFAYEHVFTTLTPTSPYEETLLAIFQNDKKVKKYNAKTLSPKEMEVLTLYAKGMKMIEISKQKQISLNTVQTHLKNIYSKLEISSKSEAISYYNRNF